MLHDAPGLVNLSRVFIAHSPSSTKLLDGRMEDKRKGAAMQAGECGSRPGRERGRDGEKARGRGAAKKPSCGRKSSIAAETGAEIALQL